MYDPKIDERPNLQHLTCRSVSYHEQEQGSASPPNGECPRRIFLPTADARLIALDADTGKPCPSFGQNGVVDLCAGKIVYKHKNGTVGDLSPVPLPFKMGVPSLGGPIVTAGGAAFLTSTLDYYIRAYDVTTCRQLWEDRLPAGGQATPMSYRSDKSGRQFLVVVAGGHGSLGTKAGDSIIAYALPQS